MTLNEIALHQKVRIIKVNGQDAFYRRLLDMGFTKGQVISVEKKAPLGDPIDIRIRGYELSLRLEQASQIEVEQL